MKVDIVFDGPPGPESGRFVEVESVDDGKSLNVGEWLSRPDGLWALRVDIKPPAIDPIDANLIEVSARSFDLKVPDMKMHTLEELQQLQGIMIIDAPPAFKARVEDANDLAALASPVDLKPPTPIRGVISDEIAKAVERDLAQGALKIPPVKALPTPFDSAEWRAHATLIAKAAAKRNQPDYYTGEGFEPHAWVVDAIAFGMHHLEDSHAIDREDADFAEALVSRRRLHTVAMRAQKALDDFVSEILETYKEAGQRRVLRGEGGDSMLEQLLKLGREAADARADRDKFAAQCRELDAKVRELEKQTDLRMHHFVSSLKSEHRKEMRLRTEAWQAEHAKAIARIADLENQLDQAILEQEHPQ